jgi:mycoredoxin
VFGTFTRRPRRAVNPSGIEVFVYGTHWCAATQRVRRFLERVGVAYSYQDIDRDPDASNRVQWWTGGYKSHPTVQVGGDILVEPTLDELQEALARHGLV